MASLSLARWSRHKSSPNAPRQECETTVDKSPTLREIYTEHAPFVCRSLRRLGVSESELDDALQDVFVVVYQRLADYEERGKTKAWLYSICTRTAHAMRRKRLRRREQLVAEPNEGETAATQLTRVEAREALALGQRLLAMLATEQREVFVLYEIEEMPMAEVADALGCPLQTAYSRLHKARERVLQETRRTLLKEGAL